MARRRPKTWGQRLGVQLSAAGGMVGGGVRAVVDRATEKVLIWRLKTLPTRVRRSVIARAANLAMTPVVKNARARVARRTGTLAASIGKRTKRYTRKSLVIVVVGPRLGFKDPKTGEVPAKIAHLVEFGTAAHPIRLGKNAVLPWGFLPKGYVIRHPGAKAQPFMRPALDSQKHVVVRRYSAEMAKGVRKQVEKLRRQNKASGN